jgi:hypothetical protein
MAARGPIWVKNGPTSLRTLRSRTRRGFCARLRFRPRSCLRRFRRFRRKGCRPLPIIAPPGTNLPTARRAGNRLIGRLFRAQRTLLAPVTQGGANNAQARSNGIATYQVNPLSRWAVGPCPYPCRCRRSQQRLPQRELQPKRRVLSSLEFPFLHATRCTFVPRCTIGRPLPSMVHCLRREWRTSKGTVSLGTQLGTRVMARRTT